MKALAALGISLSLLASPAFAAGVNNCQKQVERYKALCEKDPNATNMDACFNYKVHSRWCNDPEVTPKNQPVKACEARSAVMREEGKAAKDAGTRKQRDMQAVQNDKVCEMMRARGG